ncbi:MAG: hypothetical protein WDO19_00720 [Bacteroidota bacterium]
MAKKPDDTNTVKRNWPLFHWRNVKEMIVAPGAECICKEDKGCGKESACKKGGEEKEGVELRCCHSDWYW